MKKNENGFFLAETIIVLALVTTIMAFVFPNVSKLYDNYKTRIKYYDQTEDVLLLKEIYKLNKEKIDEKTKGCCGNKDIRNEDACTSSGNNWQTAAKPITNLVETDNLVLPNNINIENIYIVGYMENPTDNDDYSFNRYLSRIKKSHNDRYAYRLIGKFKISDGTSRYANIKITHDSICVENFN